MAHSRRINIKISHSVELEDGTYKYQGTLEGRELDFLVEYAVNSLLAQGALPFLHEDGEDIASVVMPESTTEQ